MFQSRSSVRSWSPRQAAEAMGEGEESDGREADTRIDRGQEPRSAEQSRARQDKSRADARQGGRGKNRALLAG